MRIFVFHPKYKISSTSIRKSHNISQNTFTTFRRFLFIGPVKGHMPVMTTFELNVVFAFTHGAQFFYCKSCFIHVVHKGYENNYTYITSRQTAKTSQVSIAK